MIANLSVVLPEDRVLCISYVEEDGVTFIGGGLQMWVGVSLNTRVRVIGGIRRCDHYEFHVPESPYMTLKYLVINNEGKKVLDGKIHEGIKR